MRIRGERGERIGDLVASRAADEKMLKGHGMDCKGCVVGVDCKMSTSRLKMNLEGGKEKH